MSCHGFRNNNAMLGEAQDVERVAYPLSINVSVDKTILVFKNRPIRQLGDIFGKI